MNLVTLELVKNKSLKMTTAIISFLVLVISLLTVTKAQELHSIHYEQSKQFRNQIPVVPPAASVTMNKATHKTSSSGAIFGYLPDWGYPYTKNYLRYDILTHIAVFDFQADSLGTIVNPLNWPWTDVITKAQQNNVKIILCATNFNANAIHALMTNTVYKQNLFANLKTILTTYSLDGINIDFEGLNQSDQGTNLSAFMSDLSAYIKKDRPASEISFAIPGIISTSWNITSLANACDYMFIMAYGYFGSWSTTSGACAPLTGDYYNLTNTVNVQFGSVDAKKLILGLPYYGLRWNTQTSAAHSLVRKFVTNTLYADDIVNSGSAGLQWADDQKSPWYMVAADTGWTQTWFDNDSSFGLKCQLAQSKSYKGVGIWALGYDRERTELWNKLYALFYQSNSIDKENTIVPSDFILHQNYPNPFNPETKISFTILKPEHVAIRVYDVIGKEIATIAEGEYTTGVHAISFNAGNISSGNYNVVLSVGNMKKSIKIMYLK